MESAPKAKCKNREVFPTFTSGKLGLPKKSKDIYNGTMRNIYQPSKLSNLEKH